MSALIFLAALAVYVIGYGVAAFTAWNRFVDEALMPMDFADFCCGIWIAFAAGLAWPLLLVAYAVYAVWRNRYTT